MKASVKFYLPKRTINEATDYYCKLLERGIKSAGFNVSRVEDRNLITKDDIVVIIRPRDLLGLKSKHLITWFQGIGEEEFKMMNSNKLKSIFGGRILHYFEKKALKKSKLSIFVSKSMKDFFETKYKVRAQNSLLIPCYNKDIDKDFFENSDRYNNLSFVYAGGLSKWQCIDKTLEIFKKINELEPNSSLTLLTGEGDKAQELIQKYNVKNVKVSYSTLDELQNVLSQFKYGFILREDDAVNNVATPTKMNSYLACGLIPVYTNVVHDFEEHVHLGNYEVKLASPLKSDEVANQIINHHKNIVDFGPMFSIYNSVFETYYNDKHYENTVIDSVKSLFST